MARRRTSHPFHAGSAGGSGTISVGGRTGEGERLTSGALWTLAVASEATFNESGLSGVGLFGSLVKQWSLRKSIKIQGVWWAPSMALFTASNSFNTERRLRVSR